MISFKTKLKIRRFLGRINSFVRHRYLFAIVLIALILAFVGSFSGYTAYLLQYTEASGQLTDCLEGLNLTQISYEECENKAESLSSALQDAQLELSSCLSQVSEDLSQCLKDKQSLLSENKELVDSISDCRASLTDLNITLITKEIELTDEINECQADLTEVLENYQALVENSARDICCIRRILDPELNLSYYYILDNSIECTSEYNEDLGTKEFSC